MSAEVTGLRDLMAKLQAVKGEARGTMQREVRRALMNIQEAAQDEVPYVSGELHDSISYEVEQDKLTGRVFSSQFYAPFVEFGTRVAHATPFMLPAAKRERRRFYARLRRQMRKMLRSVAE